MRNKVNIWIYWIVTYCLLSCGNNKYADSNWKPKDGYIANESSAVKVAEIVWLNVYGKSVDNNQPFKVKLKEGKVWIVEGTFNGPGLGGVSYIEIQKSDGKILKVIHGK